MSDGSEQITLNYPGGELDLGVTRATEGGSGVSVASLLSTTGYVTLDPGFTNTASCTSAITYIDGDQASCATGVTRSPSWPGSPPSSRSATC